MAMRIIALAHDSLHGLPCAQVHHQWGDQVSGSGGVFMQRQDGEAQDILADDELTVGG